MNGSIPKLTMVFLAILASSIVFLSACSKQEPLVSPSTSVPREPVATAGPVPDGFAQLLPRGGIPAIDEPNYVSMDAAKISPESFVFGLVVEGQPIAYSLNLLNGHEVVNDTVGKTNFAAVWWPLANTAVVYRRDYQGKTLNFEPSGGLTNASLVMQDKQTSTYWSLMKGAALEGEMKGEPLVTLPIGEKMTWQEWSTKHPNTKVLSVDNRQDARGSYERYFQDTKGFRGIQATDKRLETKTPIFAFHYHDKPFAISYSKIETGVSIELDDGKHLFLFRNADDNLFRSTTAILSTSGFKSGQGGWTEIGSGNPFKIESRTFGDADVESMNGFDTFWYNWSLNNPETDLFSPK